MLLHIEEIQMQKDIRNYDMKGVEFEQERADKKFLILEVSEDFASSMTAKHMWVRTECYKVVMAHNNVQNLYNFWSTVEAATHCSTFMVQQRLERLQHWVQ